MCNTNIYIGKGWRNIQKSLFAYKCARFVNKPDFNKLEDYDYIKTYGITPMSYVI